MKVLYVFDEDDKFGAPKTGMELIIKLKEKYNITPIVITSKMNNVNNLCDDYGIENYVTHHHKYTYVSSIDLKSILKFLPRFLRYKIGNLIALNICKNKIKFDEIDLIHTNISGIDLGMILSKRYNKKNILHIREFGDLDFNMKSYRKNSYDFINENANYCVAISDAIKYNWIKKGINKEKIMTIYNGVNLDFVSRQEKRKNYEKLKLIITGSICDGKGQNKLVNAISHLPKDDLNKIELSIIGTGPQKKVNELKKLIAKLNMEKIIKFKGYDSKINKKLSNYDIGLICSKSEGFGRVTIEYLASGLAVIASNTGANPELIKNGENGILYNYNNDDSLTESIHNIINNDKLRKKIVDHSKNSVRNFTIDNFSKNIFELYKKIGE